MNTGVNDRGRVGVGVQVGLNPGDDVGGIDDAPDGGGLVGRDMGDNGGGRSKAGRRTGWWGGIPVGPGPCPCAESGPCIG